jgi:chemotaxis protein CheC
MLTDQQLIALTDWFRHGSDEASAALSKWLGRPARISVERVEQVPMADATEVLGEHEAPVCFCAMGLRGRVTGQLILAFDDASGLALADMLLERRIGTSIEWGEIERSAALETANIIGCAYLNSLDKCFPDSAGGPRVILPTPPTFARDFAESMVEFALMNQAMASDLVFLTRTEFEIQGTPVQIDLLLVPDAESLSHLRELLPT